MTTLVVGFGNRHRGDDGAGYAVVDLISGTDAVYDDGDPMSAIESWSGYDRVVLVDAMRSGREVGCVERFDLDDALPTTSFVASTHAFGPMELIRLAAALHLLPTSVTLIGIEAGTVEIGAPLSTPVARSVRALAEELDNA